MEYRYQNSIDGFRVKYTLVTPENDPTEILLSKEEQIMVEFNAKKISDEDLIEAANQIFTMQEKDFEKIKSEKWYHTFFHAITLNQDGKKYAVRGIRSLAKLQQLLMNIYIKNYRKSHEQLDAVIDIVTKNSKAIKTGIL